MINLNHYRIIDLSCEMTPGERKIDGRYLHGTPLHGRPIEVEEFIAYGARMHFIHGQTHTGTHTEAAYKYFDTGADLASMAIESYMGEAVVCKFVGKQAGGLITADDFQKAGVRNRDIVLAWCEPLSDPPSLSLEAMDWLIATRIKLFAMENIHYLPLDTPLVPGYSDSKFLAAGIPFVDALAGLDQIKKSRVFFVALPVKLRRVSAFWTRAIALEEID